MEGIVGQSCTIPFVREATFILSGYRARDLVRAVPAHNYGAQTLYFRKTELTGTKITSMLEGELFIFPSCSSRTVVFSHFIWQIGAVPSATFPSRASGGKLVATGRRSSTPARCPAAKTGQFAQAFHWS
jgi:hypothetical protein